MCRNAESGCAARILVNRLVRVLIPLLANGR